MNIQIKIENKTIHIFLKNKERILDVVIFKEKHDLSEKLLPAINRLLKKNNLAVKDIKNMDILADINDSFTTYRIAKTTADSFNWAIKKI